MGASALLLRDEHGQIVIVKPHYKAVWHLPGGLMETDESPRLAAERETFEEIGLQVRTKRLLVADYKSATEARPACMQFIFDGGVLSVEQLAGIVLQANEIEAWQAVSDDDALALVAQGGPSSRLANALAVLESGVPIYLEDGQTV
ncbi:NUDIX hydrolase [Rhizocola hellebori]|uniref:NUDIX hydrolase n=2 Tax=Rhizocola hellebori TaxID=1392758 RepID=A0A8J3VIN3_9ACTN|nr:NUDIX hydrolase [Rhizocola hellebori]